MPPGGRLPGAEVDVPVAEPVARFLDGAPPRVRLGARLALRALEHSTFPRRFSKLPADKRAERLERFESGRRGLLRDLVLLVKSLVSLGYARDGLVHQALGIDSGCRKATGHTPQATGLRHVSLVPGSEHEKCDVVIVGSGAGGAAAARVLAERGLDVIVLEAGGYEDAESYSRDPFEALPRLYRDSGLTVAEGWPAIPLPLGRCVGGTTVINSGTCLRPPDDVLAGWRDELGIDWATQLDAELEALERDLDVRSVDPARAGRNAELCRTGAEALGLANGPLPRNAGDVVCCGSCPTGCALDAKQAVHVSELPRAVDAGARVRAGVEVQRLMVKGDRVHGVIADGYAVEARAVVLAGGAIGTPELLLRQGLGNRQVGRHLHIHPACWVGARYPDPVRGWEGVMQSWEVSEWRDRGLFLEATFTPLAFGAHWLRGAGAAFKQRIEGYDRLGIIGVHYSERTAEGRVRVGRSGSARVTYRLPADEAAQIRYGIARAADIHFAAGALEVHPQVGAVGSLRPGEQAGIEQGRFRPADLRLEAFHPMGSARMGADAASSAVDTQGALRGLEGAYVVDGCLLPTSLRVNPMLTIMACSRRIAAGLAERLS